MDPALQCGRRRRRRPRTLPVPFRRYIIALVIHLLFTTSAAVGAEVGGAEVRAAEVSEEVPFSFVEVVDKARDLASRPFVDPEGSVPDFLLRLDYDQWRDIRFKEEATLWRDKQLPFEVQFFHPGLFYNRMVAIHTFGDEGVQTVRFTPASFDYGANPMADKIPAEFGFAGFRLLYKLHENEHLDEVAAFLGASYFRAVAKNQVYGLSARGLAIDTGLESGEEFPYFREFWIGEPASEAREILVYALLDSKRITGAYRFSIRPGEQTDMHIEGKLFRREEIRKIGIAALTSMFFYGEHTNRRPADDFRPEVHDSDGLLVKSPREVIWRPLVNPQHLFINSFLLSDLAGFGLLQRDTDFDHYQDPEARYDLRPSALVAPCGDWGAGHVELVQIPSEHEANDNMVAYWVPDQLPEKDEPISFCYVLSWFAPGGESDELGRAIATRTAAGRMENARQLIVDFKGGRLDRLPARLPSEAPLEAVVSVGNGGELVDQQLFKVKVTDCWRLVFRVRRNGGSLADSLTRSLLNRTPIEMRAYLMQGDQRLTEVWSYAIWP